MATTLPTCSTNPEAVCHNTKSKNLNISPACGDQPVFVCEGINDGINTSCVGVDDHEAKLALAANAKLLLPQSTRRLRREHETVNFEVQCNIQSIKVVTHCWSERIHYALS
ncbi:hypothetical protein LY76DRAFT_111540 [Colletotrichum caudatum]|nr:hypothetical protein LY76DRAFT_111540 [Colletotrichum caudatum]